MLYGILVPQGLEHCVGEAQRDQILHRLLAEIMVDPVDAVVAEGLGKLALDLAAGVEIVADRLFDGDARALVGEPHLLQIAGDGPEIVGRGGKVEDAFVHAKQLGQGLIVLGVIQIALAVAQTYGEPRPGVLGERLARLLHDRLARAGDEIGFAEFGVRISADDEVFRQMPFGIQEIERGVEHFLRQIARRPEDHNRFFVRHPSVPWAAQAGRLAHSCDKLRETAPKVIGAGLTPRFLLR